MLNISPRWRRLHEAAANQESRHFAHAACRCSKPSSGECCTVLRGGSAAARRNDSAIAGQVTDATNAAIPGAFVTVTNRETGLQRRATADEQGRFNFPQLKPGAYSIKAEAKGFDPQQNDNVLSGLGQKQTVNFTLEVAKSQQTVEVSGEAPLVNPGNANTSTNLNAPALENLPNPGGDLITLTKMKGLQHAVHA